MSGLAKGGAAPGEVYADLHAHTNVSDGSDDFAQVLTLAREAGLTHIAFTNHDTLRGIEQARGLADVYGLTVIGGVEISSWDPFAEKRVHVLGLGFARDTARAIDELCAPMIAERRENSLWQVEQLEAQGYPVDRARALDLAKDSISLYKQHIMETLTDAPYESEEYQEIRRRVFKNGGVCDRDIHYVDARDAVQAIHEEGGLAVLAHPGDFGNFDFVPTLVDVGLDGIERYHTRHTAAHRRQAAAVAERYGLVQTGGSDYHGRFSDPTRPGTHYLRTTSDDPFIAHLTSV